MRFRVGDVVVTKDYPPGCYCTVVAVRPDREYPYLLGRGPGVEKPSNGPDRTFEAWASNLTTPEEFVWPEWMEMKPEFWPDWQKRVHGMIE